MTHSEGTWVNIYLLVGLKELEVREIAREACIRGWEPERRPLLREGRGGKVAVSEGLYTEKGSSDAEGGPKQNMLL